MTKRKIILMPKTKRVLGEVGENFKLARLRRRLSAEQVAERANISRPTLSAIEKGSPTVSIGSYLLVLQVLGLEKDFLLLAKDDTLGRKLQDARISTGKRAPKRKTMQALRESRGRDFVLWDYCSARCDKRSIISFEDGNRPFNDFGSVLLSE